MKISLLLMILAMAVSGLIACETPEAKAAKYDSYFKEGFALTQAGKYKESLPFYQKAIKAQPRAQKTATAYNNLGYSLAKMGSYKEAIVAYQRALQLEPNFPLAKNNLEWAQNQLAKSTEQK